jgi:hypothetical protein
MKSMVRLANLLRFVATKLGAEFTVASALFL